MWDVQTLMNDKEVTLPVEGSSYAKTPGTTFLSCDPIFGSYE
jgi:hypothetical protein